ncbi:hypothetical protein VSDG_02527 [Cytospora chrysosperma]|uniref:Uncharacterized protein n=1 Tax=Cytospora chrysosperma TaxID=252740 RepID=A0A423WFJ5_CYTCH|nr:hypothetical protein VSDG_02527 [Valsa sordida]
MQKAMSYSLFLTFISLVCACLGAEGPRQDDGGIGQFIFPVWPITNFNGGCSPGGCIRLSDAALSMTLPSGWPEAYLSQTHMLSRNVIVSFDMSNTETATEPGVSAGCDVNGDSPTWQECTALPGNTGEANGTVWAMPLSAPSSFAVSVQHRFVNDSVTPFRYWNVTGNMSVNFEQTTLPVNLTLHALSVTETWSWGS